MLPVSSLAESFWGDLFEMDFTLKAEEAKYATWCRATSSLVEGGNDKSVGMQFNLVILNERPCLCHPDIPLYVAVFSDPNTCDPRYLYHYLRLLLP